MEHQPLRVMWYDNAMDQDPNDPDWFDIERIYTFHWDAFTEADWKRLTNAMNSLPGHVETNESFARWYSPVDDPENGYLWASVEPPGLQVAGTLKLEIWNHWDEAFRKSIESFPFRDLE